MKKTLIFLRHGKTNYTQQFPDLTDEGKGEITKASEHIREIIGGRTDVHIVSSPLPRAVGTADIIARHLNHSKGVKMESALRCMDFRDDEKKDALWKSFSSVEEGCRNYGTDSRFEDGDGFEKRSEIQRRFNAYLLRVLHQNAPYNEGNPFDSPHQHEHLPDVTIHTSHYEVLWKLADCFRFSEPLSHGEVIQVDLPELSDNVMRGKFRGREQNLICDRVRVC